MGIKDTFLRSATKSSIKKNKAQRESISFKESENIGILFNKQKSFEAAAAFIQQLTAQGKTVKPLIYRKNMEEPAQNDVFTKKDIKWNGKIEAYSVEQFLAVNFDYLLYFTHKPTPHMELILAKSKAKCRVGLHTEGKEKIFELMFDSKYSQNKKELYDEVLEYLQKIN